MSQLLSKINERVLDRDSGVPLHVQIERLLRRLLQSKEFRDGRLLPGEVELSRRLSVSRNTLRVAMHKLEAEGLLHRKRRVGTSALQDVPHSSLFEWYSFTAEMRKQGIEVQNFDLTIERGRPPAEVIEGLDLDGPTPIWKLERIRGWADKPVVLALSWLHPSLEINGREDFNRPLYEVVRHLAGVTPYVSREVLRAVPATGQDASKLRVSAGTPLLLRSRTIYDQKDRPIEQNYNLYVTGEYHLTFELGRPLARAAPHANADS